MKHWKDTIIESGQIKWKRPRVKGIEDGKLDVYITIPLTSLFEAQAKKSFAAGMFRMMEFHVRKQGEGAVIELSDLMKLFNDCGLPEIARQFKE